MYFGKNFSWSILVILKFEIISAGDDDYNVLHKDGSYEFGYNNPDNYHYAEANRNNVVKGEFGGRDPKTGNIDTTHYTAGPRGYRPRGKNIVRKYDLNQNGPRAVGSRYDPYYDPYEDPSYSFSFRTRTYNRDENANRVGDVNGRYSYVDDVGERHNVEFVAGKNTGFHVKTPFPDSNPRAFGPLYFRGRGRPIPRGRTSIQRGLDGSYKFVSAGPDQRRTESSDSTGHVRGSYTYLDDKGVQHSVHYIAGPETGYRVLKNVKGPHLPTVFPFEHPNIIPPDFYDDKDVFDTAASGHIRPGGKSGSKNKSNKIDEENNNFGNEPFPKSDVNDDFETGSKKTPSKKPSRPIIPSFDDNSGYDTDFGDLFGDHESRENKGGEGNKRPSATKKPPTKVPESGESSVGTSKETSFGSSRDDGLYIPPKNGLYNPPEPSRFDGSSEEGDGFGNKPFSSGEREDNIGRSSTTNRPGTGSKPSTSKGGYRPPGSESFSGEDNFGLFGSESSRPRPPYRGSAGPVITVSEPDEKCPKCAGAIVTNVGDSYLSVPPGVSVRAHVQAIDLSPYSSRFPIPSQQYKADVSLKTEQLNASKDEIVVKNNEANIKENENFTTTEETTTDMVPTTLSPKNTTKT